MMPLLEKGSAPNDPAKVINIGSVMGHVVAPGENAPSYSVSKAAVSHLTRVMATEYVGRGVNVNCLSLGMFPSKMTDFVMKEDALKEAALSKIPMGRFGSPDDLAGMAIFMSSRASAYQTGADVLFDGGWAMHSKL
jgi:NAD(P)-dependent dehydrogenase (short-subunit alcohol dehydrogenase family)